jgi:hypothetical protein
MDARDWTDEKDCISAIQTKKIAANLRSLVSVISEEQVFVTAIGGPGIGQPLVADKGYVRERVEAKTSGLR